MCHIANHERVVRVDSMLTVVFIVSLGSVFLWSISGCSSQPEGPISATAEKPQAPGLEKEMVRYKKSYGFAEWAGETKVSGRHIVALGIKPSDFTKWGKVKVYDPNLRLKITPSPDKKIARVKVSITIMPSAIEAHEGILRYLALCTLPPPVFMKAEKEGRWDVGDVCFHLIQFPDRSVLFARNNVLVHLRGTSPEDTEMRIDVAALAKFIDKKLVASLVPVKQEKER